MQEDKTIKMLFQEYGTQEPSSAFNNNVMQRISAATVTKPSSPLLNAFTINLLKIAFTIVVIALVVCIAFLPLKDLPVNFWIDINSNTYRQLFSFILVFWTGMFLNIWLNKRWLSERV